MKNKWFVMGVFLLAFMIVASPFSVSPARSAEKPPLKVGVLLAFSGWASVIGQTAVQGVKLAFVKRDYKLAGRKVELIVEDSEGKPPVALMKVKKLVEKDGIKLFFGPVLSSSAYAIKEYLRQNKIPWMNITASAGGITRKKMNPYLFRVWYGSGTYYAAQWAAKEMGSKKAIFCGFDYAYGRELGEGFKRGFTEAGGAIVGEMYTAVGTKDFGPYLAAVGKLAESTGANTLAFVYAGADAIAFVKQLQEFGIRDKFKVKVSYGSVFIGKILRQMGDAAEGHHDVAGYYYHADNAANREFIGLMEKEYGPGSVELMAAIGYLGADTALRAAEKINGDVEDVERYRKTLLGMRYDSHFGPFEFDPKDQNIMMNWKILKTIKVGDKMDQQLVYTFPKTRDWYWLQ